MTQRRWDEQEPTPSIATGEASVDYRFLDGILQGPNNVTHVSRDAQRRQARLAVILENLFRDTCYEHGEECQAKADCWAREIIAREAAWC